jgi:hypothetical protein
LGRAAGNSGNLSPVPPLFSLMDNDFEFHALSPDFCFAAITMSFALEDNTRSARLQTEQESTSVGSTRLLRLDHPC